MQPKTFIEFTTQQTNPQDIKVKLLLTGGYPYTLYLKLDAPLLYSLMNTIAKRSVAQSALLASYVQNQAAVSSLFQIPLEEGRAALCFSSEQLVGLVTEPPVYWQKVLETQPPVADILTSQYVQIDDFLTLEEKKQLLDYVVQNEADFVSTSTSTGDLNYRRLMTLYSFPEFS